MSDSRQMSGVGSLMFITHHFVVRWYQGRSYFHSGISLHISKCGTGMSRSRTGLTDTSPLQTPNPPALLLWGQNGCTMRVISSFGILKWNSLCGAINIMRNQFYGWQNTWVTRSTNLWSYSRPQDVRLAKYLWHSFSQHTCFLYLRYYCLKLCGVLYEHDGIQRVFILSEMYLFRI